MDALPLVVSKSLMAVPCELFVLMLKLVPDMLPRNHILEERTSTGSWLSSRREVSLAPDTVVSVVFAGDSKTFNKS